MARACSCCTHKESAALDTDILAGILSVGQLIEKYRVGESSLRRHRINHLSGTILRDPQADAGTGTQDLLERLAQLLDDASAVRAAGLLANKGDLVLRANRESRATIEILLTRLGIDDLSVIERSKNFATLIGGVMNLMRKYPKIGTLLAEQFDSSEDHETAQQVRGYVTHFERIISQREGQP